MLTFTGIFNQLPINGELEIPEQKPSMEYILDSQVNIDFEKKQVIDTPLLYPEDLLDEEIEEPRQLRKIVVTGTANIKIIYSALEPTQKVHSAHFEIPFCDLIEWPGGPPQGTPIEIDPVIEKEVFRRVNERDIYKALLIRFDIYR